ncbi:hypothetical protein PoB_001643200 [Plakobranchus ocellatus]|uniref:Uncharacterized protein n=1 Tax=Plakobranchus ocellatus TaxID=259542 RepID=A0AAV3Z3V7_9GAST|nr:hypothetical protein PoB_001643200 [Plakobranchus ocellatus]
MGFVMVQYKFEVDEVMLIAGLDKDLALSLLQRCLGLWKRHTSRTNKSVGGTRKSKGFTGCRQNGSATINVRCGETQASYGERI